MAGAVRIEGLRETSSALRQIDRKLPKLLVGDELKQIARPVVDTAKGLIGRYAGAKVSSIRPRATGTAVYVRQGARKVTGKRGDYGLLQQRKLEESLDKNQRAVMREAEAALDRITRSAGF